MLKALVIDPGKCTGCKQCEMACSYENEQEFNVSKSRIRVFDFHEQGKMVPYTCTQCAEAWCQQACPVNAITTDAMGVKKEKIAGRIRYIGIALKSGQDYQEDKKPPVFASQAA